MNTLEELATAVSKMRTCQKKYFKRRTNQDLQDSKKAEQEVDALLTKIAPTCVAVKANLAEQMNLFS